MRPEQKRVKQLLTEAITLLCRNSLQFKEDVTVEGLLGITLDKSDIFLVSIKETIQQSLRENASGEKRSVTDASESSHSPKKRRRRGSREGSSSPPQSQDGQADKSHGNSKRISIKQENNDDTNTGMASEDGRRFHPAHDSTAEDPADNKSLIQKQALKILSSCGSTDSGQVQVKQERVEEEEEECFLVDSDEEKSHSSIPPDSSSMEQSWTSAGDHSGFNLTDLDMMAAGNFPQQFGTMGMEGGANNMGPQPGTWDPSQIEGGQPSTSGTQDDSPRVARSGSPDSDAGPHEDTKTAEDFSSEEASFEKKACLGVATVAPLLFKEVGGGNDPPESEPCGTNLTFVCNECGAKFSSKGSLNRHSRKHTGQMLACTFCTRSFYSRSDLKHHIDIVHFGTNKHICSEPNCGKSYGTITGLRRHQCTHTGVYKYVCDLCGEGFTYSSKLKEHVDRHHGMRTHHCLKCEKSFIRKCDLDFHKTICGASMEVSCPVCHKLFKHEKYMKAHQRVHDSPSKYKCAECGKTYSHRGSLKKHMDTHFN